MISKNESGAVQLTTVTALAKYAEHSSRARVARKATGSTAAAGFRLSHLWVILSSVGPVLQPPADQDEASAHAVAAFGGRGRDNSCPRRVPCHAAS